MQTTHTETAAAKRLATLAVLRANWAEGRQSYVDTFLPFALEAVRLEGGHQVGIAELRARMDAEFGMDLPAAAIESVLRGKRGKKLGSVRAGSFVLSEGRSLDEFDTAAARQTARREQLSLIERLVEVASEHDLIWSEQDAAEAIANYLERHATSLLAASHGHDLGSRSTSADVDRGESEFVVAVCFSRILERDPEGAAYLDHLVVGTMVASALYTPDLDHITDPFTCDVYLDTPTLIDALGHGGTIYARPARESIGLLREAGATIKCFDHTAVEMERKLCDSAEQLRDRRRGIGADPILSNAISRNLTPEDLEQAAGRVRGDIERLNIEIVPAPQHEEGTSINEVEAEKVLVEMLGHSRRSTIQFDLDSIAGIYRIRRGRRKHRIETCGAVFATPHGRLLGAARQIFPVGRRDVPVAIGLADLVTLAWLKKPRAMPNLPRLRIAGDCYATVQPSPGLVRRYVDEAVKLHKSGAISEDDLHELRYGTESRRILMQKTKGSTSAVDADLVRGILRERDDRIAARARSDAERDVNALQAELGAERAGRDAENARFSARIDELERRTTDQETELSRIRAAEEKAIDRRARRIAKWIVRPIALGVFVIAMFVALLTVPFVGNHIAAPIGLHVLATLPHRVAWVIRVLAIVLGAVVLVLNMWGWGFGRGMTTAEHWVQGALKRRAARDARRED